MLSVIKHAVDAASILLSSAQPRTTHAVCNSVSCRTAKLLFFDSYSSSSPEMNSNDCIGRFMESCDITNMLLQLLQVSDIEEVKQRVDQLRQTINAALEGRDFRVSEFTQVEQRH